MLISKCSRSGKQQLIESRSVSEQENAWRGLVALLQTLSAKGCLISRRHQQICDLEGKRLSFAIALSGRRETAAEEQRSLSYTQLGSLHDPHKPHTRVVMLTGLFLALPQSCNSKHTPKSTIKWLHHHYFVLSRRDGLVGIATGYE